MFAAGIPVFRVARLPHLGRQIGAHAGQVADDNRGLVRVADKRDGFRLQWIMRPRGQPLEIITGHRKADGRRNLRFRDADARFGPAHNAGRQ